MAQGVVRKYALAGKSDVRGASASNRSVVMLLGMTGILIAVFLLKLVAGSVSIPLSDVVAVLHGGTASKVSWQTIILDFRLPQALTAILAGAALGVSGLLMQTLFRNPLADPFILGISSGASLGVALVVLAVGTVTTTFLTGLSFLGDLSVATAASLGAGIVMIIVLTAARRIANGMTLLILGLLFSYMTGSIVSLLLYFSIPERIQAYISWTFGSYSGVTWDQLAIMLPIIALGLVAAFVMSKPLNILLLGEEYAWSMGVNITQLRIVIILATSLLAGTVTAFCGPIGFIGIAVPHLCRNLFNTADHRLLIPATILTGAVMSVIASLIASLPGSNIVLPINAITAFIGAPTVIWVILHRRNIEANVTS
ncbi:MAG: iron ABC transporter permease [Anaerolineae bacterium]|nr:iron ABC transporter permease [Anaerolineae bacterium]